MKIPLRTVALGVGLLGTAMSWNLQASAYPVYIGLQDSAVNGGAITLETIGAGSASLSSTAYGDFTLSAQGLASPTLAEPSVQSSDLAAVSSGAQTLNIFVTATNEFPVPPGFLSSFTSNALASGWSLIETTYVTTCPGGVCPVGTTTGTTAPAGLFGTANQLDTITFTGLGTNMQGAANPGLAAPYEITEEYTIVASGANDTTGASGNIDVSATPLPSTWTMLIASLLGLGLFAYRGSKKRSSSVSMLDASAVA